MIRTRTADSASRGTDRARGDADIEHMAAADPGNPASAAEDWAEATIGFPLPKTPVNAKFDIDEVDWFKSQGRSYPSRMNAVLRRHMEAHRRKG